jgi:hypothetical protein
MLIYRFRKSDMVFDQAIEVPDDTKAIPPYHTFEAPPEKPGHFAVMRNGWVLYKGEKPSDPEQAPEYIKSMFNMAQRQNRAQAYKNEADVLFFKAQRGEATTEEWLAKVEEIKEQFPYQE